MNKKHFTIVIIGLAIVLIGINTYNYFQNDKKQISISTSTTFAKQDTKIKAEDFELNTLTGETLSLSEFKGKKVVINFFATWCPPCKAEMPHIQSFYEKHQNEDIAVIAVNVTNIDRGEKAIQQFANDYGLTFPILLDNKGEVSSIYQATTIPTTYIIDRDGYVFQKIIGPVSEDMLENLLKKLK